MTRRRRIAAGVAVLLLALGGATATARDIYAPDGTYYYDDGEGNIYGPDGTYYDDGEGNIYGPDGMYYYDGEGNIYGPDGTYYEDGEGTIYGPDGIWYYNE